ncbi:MAG: hypothetical protein ABIP19_03265 [Dermatophilaceae bacterium]
MAEQTRPVNGTVAEEAARLIEAMASMASAGAVPRKDPSSRDGGQSRDAGSPAEAGASGADNRHEHSDSTCAACGGERSATPVACKLCPLCQGIALLRSVRPETVDRLADLASAVASSLRDVATQSRASGPSSTNGSASGQSSGGGRATVQDIPVDDEDGR